jgi:CMP-2-keto-3-deoxyoctulosonic acid synthetase
MSRVDHVQKIRDRKQRTDIGKYSFVNRAIKDWNQLPAEVLEKKEELGKQLQMG